MLISVGYVVANMNLNIFPRSQTAKYRWHVFLRCILAIFAGLFIATLIVPIMAFSLPQSLGIATLTGLLLSFTVWLCYIIYAFSCKSIRKLSLMTLIIFLIMASLAFGLKSWSGL